MGYDFLFIRLNDRRKRSFPLSCDLLVEADSSGELPWSDFRTWLVHAGGRINGDSNSIWIDYPDGGSVNFAGKDDGIYLDTHSHWKYVLEAYCNLEVLDENCCIFDMQSGILYDETSFRDFMKTSYEDEK